MQYLTNSAINLSAIEMLNIVKTKFQILENANVERALSLDFIINGLLINYTFA